MLKSKWSDRFMGLAQEISSWSSDPATKVGSVIVSPDNVILATGYNGIPRGVNYREERTERPEKYDWFEHAERNAIYNAARTGTSLVGAHLYVTLLPCTDCARGIIQSGIKVVYSPRDTEDRWRHSQKKALAMLAEAGIVVLYL